MTSDDVSDDGRNTFYHRCSCRRPTLTYLHIILMTDDGDVLNDVFDDVGRCWMMFWMKLIDVLDDVG